ncbi:hypothetical protein [Bremerella cremea]|nr:hypothetical protein [Bremerella cremea]
MPSKPLILLSLITVGLLAVGGGIAPSQVTAQESDPADPSMSSLDQELFNDLGSDLFDDLNLPAEAKEAPKSTQPPSQEKPPAGQPDPSDDAAEGARGFGADPSAKATSGDPLSKIGGLMREVQQRIAEGQAEQQTVAMQQEIIEEINKLLEQQQQQQNQKNNSQQQQNQNQEQQQQNQQQNQQQSQQGQQQSSDQSQQSGQQQSQQQNQQQSGQPSSGSDSQPSESQMQQGKQAQEGQDSSDQLRNEAVLAISPEEQDALIKKAWGNLPPHLRKQISNTSMERFLPKYERLTQEYFRKLAEVEP